MPTLTLEQLQANLRRLAERLEYGMDDDDCDTVMDLDAVAMVLYGLAEGDSGDVIADALELPAEYPDFDEDEDDDDYDYDE